MHDVCSVKDTFSGNAVPTTWKPPLPHPTSYPAEDLQLQDPAHVTSSK